MSTDMTGREVREPGRAGERYREARERRIRESRERRAKHWAKRVEAAETPLQAFRVFADRVSAAMVQQERRAALAYERVRRDQPDSRKERAVKTHLDKTRAAITADLVWLSEQMHEIATSHETTRV